MTPLSESHSALSVIVPIYNEASSLPDVLPGLLSFCREHNYALILVNDGSTDATKTILADYENLKGVTILQHKLNRGYGGAIKTGIRAAKTPYVVTIDADGQHQAGDIEELFQFAVKTDADMVIGSRNKPTSGWYRETGKWLIRSFTRLLVSLPVYDLNSGFKLYRSDLAKRYINVCPDTMAFSDAITLVFVFQRHSTLETPITIRTRKAGASTINVFTAFNTLIEILNLIMLFNPLRVFIPLSMICVAVGLIWGIPIVLLGRGVSVGSMLAIVVGTLFFFLGLIAGQLSAIRLGRFTQDNREDVD